MGVASGTRFSKFEASLAAPVEVLNGLWGAKFSIAPWIATPGGDGLRPR